MRNTEHMAEPFTLEAAPRQGEVECAAACMPLQCQSHRRVKRGTICWRRPKPLACTLRVAPLKIL